MACRSRNSPGDRNDGSRRFRRAPCQHDQFCSALGVPIRRQQHTVRLAGSRNDVIGNCAALLAALGIFGTGTGWPDVVVALIMGGLAIQGAWVVTRAASREIAGAPA